MYTLLLDIISYNVTTYIIYTCTYNIIGERSEPPLSVELSEFSLYLYIYIYIYLFIGERSEPPLSVELSEFSLYLYIYIYIYIYLFIYFRLYVVHVPLTRHVQTLDRQVEVQRSI